MGTKAGVPEEMVFESPTRRNEAKRVLERPWQRTACAKPPGEESTAPAAGLPG